MTTEKIPERDDTPCKGDDTVLNPTAQLDIAQLRVRFTDIPKQLPKLETLTFGTTFSDHMAIASYHPTTGWSAPEIKPYAPLTLDPASSCLQYGTTIFEGMKAYLGRDGKARLFRPEMNMRRLERSVARLALPALDGDVVLELIKHLVRVEKRWIAGVPGYSLYLRPTMIGTRPALGLAPSDHATFYILALPTGPYFPRPISLVAVCDTVRAWPGGTGGQKIGGNYSPTFLPTQGAVQGGYDHVLWLLPLTSTDRKDGEEGDGWVTEGGVMNIFAVVDRQDGSGWDVITAPLDGTILPGVTRASCLELLADPTFVATVARPPSPLTGAGTETKGDEARLHPAERAFTMSELVRWTETGALREVFCVGTAVLVCAVHRIGFRGRDLDVRPTYPMQADVNANEHGLGLVGGALRAFLLRVQDGTVEHNGWSVACE